MFQIETLDTNEGAIWDIAVPILGGRAGIARVGMSSRYLLESVSATTRRLIITTGLVLVIGLLAAYLLTLVLVRPIIQLAEATKAITKGNLEHRAPVWASDEIGKLGIAFNAMTQYLVKSRNESEAFHAELLRRNRELSALNAVIIGVSRPQGLANMMHHSLAEVLEAMGLNAGWVSTLTEDGK
jgi:nitrogen fixation/metabolism regulation signal transduction histidine kinase